MNSQSQVKMPFKDELKWMNEYPTKPKVLVWIVGFIDFFNHELKLERIEAATWQDAVVQHSMYPYKGTENSDEILPQELSLRYEELEPEESFKQSCFDCDSMMNWIEL